MEKLINKLNNSFEKNINKVTLWLLLNKFRIVFLVIISLFIVLISFLPYVNLFLTKNLMIFIIVVFLFVIFKVSWRNMICVIFLLFFFTFVLTLLAKNEVASLIADYIYGFLAVALIKYFFE